MYVFNPAANKVKFIQQPTYFQKFNEHLTTFLIQGLHFFLEYFLLNHRYQNVDFVGFLFANRMGMNVRPGTKSAKNKIRLKIKTTELKPK